MIYAVNIDLLVRAGDEEEARELVQDELKSLVWDNAAIFNYDILSSKIEK